MLLILLYIGIIISFLNSYGYGFWDILSALWSLNIKKHFTSKPVRSINQIYILVPAMNEAHTILQSVRYLREILVYTHYVYPNVDCKLIFIDDASTDGTSLKLDKAVKKYPYDIHVIHRHLPNAQEGKGMALDNALEWIDNQHKSPNKTVIGVLDSDSTPSKDLLVHIKKAFDYSHDNIIQTSILINNVQSFLTVMQLFEFNVPNFLSQILRSRWGSGLASGNGQFMTLKMTDKIRWRNSLLDDLEFSINGLLNNFRGTFLSNVAVPQEGVLTYKALIKQRTRWCQGGMQCLFKYGKRIFKCPYISKKLKTDMFFFMISPFLSFILTPCSLLTMILLIFYLITNFLAALVPILLIILMNCIITIIMIETVSLIRHLPFTSITKHHSLKMIFGNMIYLWYLAPVPYISLARLIMGHNSWSKTAH